jgi:small subunit ribosomal protein S20
MPHHKACAKHDRASVRRKERNRAAQSVLRAALRKVRTAKGKDDASGALKSAFSVIDKSVKAGLLHRNNAANKKSRLSKLVQKLAV